MVCKWNSLFLFIFLFLRNCRIYLLHWNQLFWFFGLGYFWSWYWNIGDRYSKNMFTVVMDQITILVLGFLWFLGLVFILLLSLLVFFNWLNYCCIFIASVLFGLYNICWLLDDWCLLILGLALDFYNIEDFFSVLLSNYFHITFFIALLLNFDCLGFSVRALFLMLLMGR